MPPLRWAVLVAGLDPVKGHEQGGQRRVLVVSREAFHRMGVVTVCPITTNLSIRYPGAVAISEGEAGQTKPGLVLCYQIRTISLERVSITGSGFVGHLMDQQIRAQIREAIATHFGLITPGLDDGARSDEVYGLP